MKVATCAELKGESIKSISQLNSGSHSALLQDCIDKVSAELHCDGKRRLVESSMTVCNLHYSLLDVLRCYQRIFIMLLMYVL